MRLDRAFYAQPTLRLAKSLLGKHLVHDSEAGRISGWIEQPAASPRFRMARSTRIGIRQGTELLYRYFVDGNRFVSGRASCHSVPRNRSFGDW
jgi:3-methyladenine DNA glycosylase Mpg